MPVLSCARFFQSQEKVQGGVLELWRYDTAMMMFRAFLKWELVGVV
jgi:hypothetical protein